MSYQILVVGGDHIVSDAIRSAWKLAGAELVGPVARAPLLIGDFKAVDGALLDVSGETDVLFTLSERLETAQLPFLFVVTAADFIRGAGFTISSDPFEISAILTQLFPHGDIGTKH